MAATRIVQIEDKALRQRKRGDPWIIYANS